MNLLPPEILQKRQLTSLYIKMAAIQAVIFLLIVLIVAGLSLAIRVKEAQVSDINMKLQEPRFERSEYLVRLIHVNYSDSIVNVNEILRLPDFNITWADRLDYTLPTGVQLMQFETDFERATLIAQTRNISLADIHREAWLATGLVHQISMASAIYLDGGVIQYVLDIVWSN